MGPATVVRCPAGTSPPFTIQTGVHQGSALSPLLFILCMDVVTADIQRPHPWSLLYADDVFLAATSRQELAEQVQLWSTRLADHGLRLNAAKTEYLECGEQTDGSITVDGHELPKSTQFKYLGSAVRTDGDSLSDASSRSNIAWLKWRQTTGVMCDRRMPLRLKSRIYKTVIRPAALYGCECWPTTVKHEQILHVAEMRMLRWSLGLTRIDRVWNSDIRNALGGGSHP